MARDNNKSSCCSIVVLIVTTVLACHLATLVQGTKYSVCDQDKSSATVSNVIVSDCEKLDDTCPFVRGFNKSIELDFVPKQKIEQVRVKVAGKLSQLPVPFNVSPDMACGNYGFQCPLEPNKTYKFALTLPILRTYPKINVNVFVRLIDEKDNLIACIELPAKILEPQKDSPTAPAGQ